MLVFLRTICRQLCNVSCAFCYLAFDSFFVHMLFIATFRPSFYSICSYYIHMFFILDVFFFIFFSLVFVQIYLFRHRHCLRLVIVPYGIKCLTFSFLLQCRQLPSQKWSITKSSEAFCFIQCYTLLPTDCILYG